MQGAMLILKTWRRVWMDCRDGKETGNGYRNSLGNGGVTVFTVQAMPL